MKIKVVLVGCDDETAVNIDVTPEQLEFLEYLQHEVNTTSSYTCMPTLSIQEIKS